MVIANVVIFSLMGYNRKGYFVRAARIQELTAKHYERENHSKCYKMVWRKEVYPVYGICYRTYLRYLKVGKEEVKEDTRQLKLSIWDF